MPSGKSRENWTDSPPARRWLAAVAASRLLTVMPVASMTGLVPYSWKKNWRFVGEWRRVPVGGDDEVAETVCQLRGALDGADLLREADQRHGHARVTQREGTAALDRRSQEDRPVGSEDAVVELVDQVEDPVRRAVDISVGLEALGRRAEGKRQGARWGDQDQTAATLAATRNDAIYRPSPSATCTTRAAGPSTSFCGYRALHDAAVCDFSSDTMRDATRFGADTTTDEVLEGSTSRQARAGHRRLERARAGDARARWPRKGAHVILTARDVPKGEASPTAIRAATGNQHVEVEELELGVAGEHPRLRRALPRAPRPPRRPRQQRRRHGLPARRRRPTASSCSSARTTSATSCYLPARAGAAAGRAEPRRLGQLARPSHRRRSSSTTQFERRPYDKWPSYGQAKTANVLFAVGLERRLGAARRARLRAASGRDHDRARPTPACPRTSSSSARATPPA